MALCFRVCKKCYKVVRRETRHHGITCDECKNKSTKKEKKEDQK